MIEENYHEQKRKKAILSWKTHDLDGTATRC